MRKTIPALFVLGLFLVPFPVSAAPMNNVCRTVDADDAMAAGDAAVLQVLQGPGAPYTLSKVEATQSGPGMAHDANETGHVHVGDVVKLTVAPARTDVKVAPDGASAGAWTTAKLLDLDVLDGLVTAEVVTAATYATADQMSARTDSGSSTIVGLKVSGVSVHRVEPGLEVPVPVLFGTGSFIRLHERTEDSSFPDGDVTAWTGDVTVRMVHVYLADHDLVALGAQPLEVVVGMSNSVASVPTPLCGLQQYANAGAYIARLRPDIVFSGESIVVGEQRTGPVDGNALQQLLDQSVPVEEAVLKVDGTVTAATTRLDPGVASHASAMAEATGVCLLRNGTDDCLVSATLVKAESHSLADGERAISWGHTTLVDLKVAGVDVCEALGLESTCSPAYNTKLEVAGIRIVLNEREHTSAQPGHTDLAVRAAHLTVPGIGDVYLARSYSEASFVQLG